MTLKSRAPWQVSGHLPRSLALSWAQGSLSLSEAMRADTAVVVEVDMDNGNLTIEPDDADIGARQDYAVSSGTSESSSPDILSPVLSPLMPSTSGLTNCHTANGKGSVRVSEMMKDMADLRTSSGSIISSSVARSRRRSDRHSTNSLDAVRSCSDPGSSVDCGITPRVILPAQLGSELMSGGDFLILDVRSIASYQREHIQGALSVTCSTIFQRRLAKGKCRVRDLICESERRRFIELQRSITVVVYDERSQTLAPAESNPLFLYFSALSRESSAVVWLKGGFSRFKDIYSCLCESHHATSKPTLTLQLPTPQDSSRSKSDSHLRNDYESDLADIMSPSARHRRARMLLQAPPSLILPNLFLGAKKDAEDRDLLERLGVNAVLNVTPDCPNYHHGVPGFRYKQLPIYDTWHQNIAQFFDESFDFIDMSFKEEDESRQICGRTLVHCSAGISRSATIVIAYLMRKNHWSLNHAYAHVKSVRPTISPNLDFMGHLLSLERTLGVDREESGSPMVLSETE